MFKKLLLLSLVPCAAHAMKLEQAREEIKKRLVCCVYRQEMVRNTDNTYSRYTATPNPKVLCEELQNIINGLDPYARMQLLFNDQNVMRAFPVMKQLHKPLELVHSNQDIFECLKKLYTEHEAEMYVSFIKKTISETIDTKAYPQTLQTLKKLPMLMKEDVYKAVLKHDNNNLLRTTSTLNIKRFSQETQLLSHTTQVLYNNADVVKIEHI